MAGTPEGARKTREKLLAQYGGEEGLKAHMQTIGTKGGYVKPKGKRGFASLSKERLVEVGRKGGLATHEKRLKS